jgi:hypothetical protein
LRGLGSFCRYEDFNGDCHAYASPTILRASSSAFSS